MAEGFFDIYAKANARPESPPSKPAAEAMTISQLTQQIDRILKQGFPNSLSVKGEISNFVSYRGSGHLYFTLKDSQACIDCVMWKSDAAKLKFQPSDGMEMLARGKIAVYATRGRYQLYVTSLHPLGQGALELVFQQLRAKLEAEGLFAAERKKPLPTYPMRIAIVTSRATAALQDMLKVLRRFSWLRLYLYDVPVQGEGAAAKIAAAIAHLNRAHKSVGGVDLILLGRGGGSLEDLWQFNEESVARAVAASKIPIVSGIGHEVDVSIADLVADYHAHTPTEAAQVATANWKQAAASLLSMRSRLTREIRSLVQDARHRLRAIERHEIFRRPLDRIVSLRQRIDEQHRSLNFVMSDRVRDARSRIAMLAARLNARHPQQKIIHAHDRLTAISHRLVRAIRNDQQRRTERLATLSKLLAAVSPQEVLRRGYSITAIKKGGAIVRSKSQIHGGETIVTRLHDGEIESTASDPKQPKLF